MVAFGRAGNNLIHKISKNNIMPLAIYTRGRNSHVLHNLDVLSAIHRTLLGLEVDG